jgi:ABC-2 type transport system permease protein
MSATMAPSPVAGRRRPMSIWRLEWLRLTRSHTGIVLAAVYLAFGLLGPVMAVYLQDLVKLAQSGVTITVAPPTPKDGIAHYVSQVGQTGLIVVVVVAASALAFDARRGLAVFLRTRVRSMWSLVGARAAVVAAAAVVAYTAGTLAAWYETTLLIGDVNANAVLAGLVCGSVYLVFAVSVVTAAASLSRTTLGTVGIALAVLLLLPLAGTVTAIHDWLPSTLANAPVDLLVTTQLSDYRPALGVAIAAAATLLTVAVKGFDRREV